jgi:SOS-response transcriptional repressor LexA
MPKRQDTIYDFVTRFHEENGRFPTTGEIQRALSVSSKSLVRYHIRRLRDSGRLAWEAPPRKLTADAEARRVKIYNFIVSYRDEHGYSPTIEEIRSTLCISSVSVVAHHIKMLIRKGWLTKRAGSPRTLVPIHESNSTKTES